MQGKQLTLSFWRKLYFDLAWEVDQVLGKALNYPYYSSDQKNFPGTTEKDGVCTGDHVPESLLEEAAGRLSLDMLKPKPLTFKEFENTPCTAELEVNLEKLATYFERRSRENNKRAERLEQKRNDFQDLNKFLENDRSSYYFSGKEDTYKRAAQKVRELLTPKKQDKPENWIVEVNKLSGWDRSVNPETSGEFVSTADAVSAIQASHKRNLLRHEYRIVRKDA